jgi:hypothetical protein
MNIIVKPYGCSGCYCRPDTTWQRENKDLYVPDGIKMIRWAPVAFARVSKAGKCINPKFVTRYYDSFGFGAMLYCNTEECEHSTSIAFTSCMDHTSILPSPLCEPEVLENSDKAYQVKLNGTDSFNTGLTGIRRLIEDGVCTSSKLTSLRIGDYVAVELSPVMTLASSTESETLMQGDFDEKRIFDFKVIF